METHKKYKLTDECITIDNKTLYRIEAIKDFGSVKKGDKGGFVESEKNLVHYGNCWIYNDAKVYDNACVYDDAIVRDYAQVYNAATIDVEAKIGGGANVYDNAAITGNAIIHSNAKVHGDAIVCNNAIVSSNAHVFNNAQIYDNAKILGNSLIYGKAKIGGSTVINDNVEVYKTAVIFENANIIGNAKITSISDYIIFKNWWSSGRYFTWTRSNNMWSVGCFYGTGEELITKAYEDSRLSGIEYERIVKYVESILKDNKQ